MEGMLEKKVGVSRLWLACTGRFSADKDFVFSTRRDTVAIPTPAVARISARPGADPAEFEVETRQRTLVFKAQASDDCTARDMVRRVPGFTPQLQNLR